MNSKDKITARDMRKLQLDVVRFLEAETILRMMVGMPAYENAARTALRNAEKVSDWLFDASALEIKELRQKDEQQRQNNSSQSSTGK